jgi:hypothetical protein
MMKYLFVLWMTIPEGTWGVGWTYDKSPQNNPPQTHSVEMLFTTSCLTENNPTLAILRNRCIAGHTADADAGAA